MERLTMRNAFGEVTVSGKDDNDINRKYRQIANRLAELEDKLESGQLVELPCKLGKNFVIKDYGFNRLRVEECRIVGYNFSQFESTIYPVDEFKYPYSPDKVFETKSQAKARLKELQEKL